MSEAAALLAGACAAATAFLLTLTLSRWPAVSGLTRSLGRMRQALRRLRRLFERVDGDRLGADRAGRRRLKLLAAALGAAIGFLIGGPALAAVSALMATPALEAVLRSRRRDYARRVDAAASELALALASALAAGHSVYGALLAAGGSSPPPLDVELRHVAVDLTLGRSVDDALAALRDRTGSARVESLTGAIALHRGCGGDLVRLMRELANAFRARDLARQDARAATAQARFTAALVAAMPLAAGVLAEFASPGSVSGALSFAPTAMMLLFACAMLAIGVALCLRVARV